MLPLKMFEYLALGKPVVATSSEVLKQFEEVLYLADDEDTFLKHIENAITDNNREHSELRRACALKYSWKKSMRKYNRGRDGDFGNELNCRYGYSSHAGCVGVGF